MGRESLEGAEQGEDGKDESQKLNNMVREPGENSMKQIFSQLLSVMKAVVRQLEVLNFRTLCDGND